MAQAPAIPSLPEYSADDEWLQLSLKIITTSGNTDNTVRFLALYKSLPKDVQRDHKNLLISNGATTYDDLVTALSDRFSMPDHSKFQTLHTLESIGDRSPKQFLRDLKCKYEAAGGINNTNLRFAFALGLPSELRNIVFSCDPNNLTEAAARVDDLYNANKSLTSSFNPYTQNFQVNAVNNDSSKISSNSSNPVLETQRLNNNLELMTEMLQNFNSRLTQLETAQNQNQSNYQIPQTMIKPPISQQQLYKKSNCPALPSSANPMGLCFYHGSFGFKARKCNKDDCNWKNFKIPVHVCKDTPCPWNKYNQTQQEN